MDPLTTALKVGASGLAAQSERLRIVSENLANAQSTGNAPGADAYRRKTITFAAELDRATGANSVQVQQIARDRSDFPVEYNPGHEAADAAGYVKLPNVNILVEMSDMREAVRGYEANLNTIKQARDIVSMTIDLLRSQ
ncbi:MAG: flagellar basal body rod protein FlgC [Rhizobiaceae bacterium]|nr:flagellar basal body rod protein FlgC [Rhizobiaceae bacterium]